MKSRPILFSGPMVRALLDGTKTQTRRIVKPQPTTDRVRCFSSKENCYFDGDDLQFKCPYGVPGDQLWVRETWKTYRTLDGMKPSLIVPGPALLYTADGGCSVRHPEAESWGQTRVSIFMPRWACRLHLDITDVRVERLQDISRDDCYAEGIERPNHPNFGSDVVLRDNARNAYRMLWDSLNAKRGFGWATNPWVWVLTFKRVEPTPAPQPDKQLP